MKEALALYVKNAQCNIVILLGVCTLIYFITRGSKQVNPMWGVMLILALFLGLLPTKEVIELLPI
jgi:hypothetical protein